MDDPNPKPLPLSYARPIARTTRPLPTIVADWFAFGSFCGGVLLCIGLWMAVGPRNHLLRYWGEGIILLGLDFFFALIAALMIASGAWVRRRWARGRLMPGPRWLAILSGLLYLPCCIGLSESARMREWLSFRSDLVRLLPLGMFLLYPFVSVWWIMRRTDYAD
jgi:hypothetical protein